MIEDKHKHKKRKCITIMLAQTFLIRYSMSVKRGKKAIIFSFICICKSGVQQTSRKLLNQYVAAHDMPFWSLGGAAFVVGPARSTRLGGFNGGFV